MSNFPHWLEKLLGLDPAGTGEGTTWSVDHAWSWAPWFTLLFLCAVGALVVAFYWMESVRIPRWQRAALAAIRVCLIALVLFMLAEFMLTPQRTGLSYVVVVLDDSASMSIVDRYDDERLRRDVARQLEKIRAEEPSRINLAKSILLADDARLLSSVARDYKLRFYLLSTTARDQAGTPAELARAIADIEASGTASRLGEGLRSVLADLRGAPPAAMILLTDGINTEGEPLSEAATYARRKGVPLFTVALGNSEPLKDLELTDLLVDEVVFVDDIVNFQFKLTGSGFEGEQVKVRLRAKDSTEVLAELDVTVGPDGEPQRLQLPYRPTEVGEFEYVVQVDPLPDELKDTNNAQSRVVSVRKEQIRVLLVQAYPNYEFRYLKHMLQRDSTIQLHTYLQEADPEYAEQDETALRVFPVRREEIFAYDVIVFGDVNPAYLSSSVLEYLAEFVTDSGKGGGMIFISGPQYTPQAYRDTPLATLFPFQFQSSRPTPTDEVIAESFTPLPTELGLASSHMNLGDTPAETINIWRNLPGAYWHYTADTLKPAARVLAVHPRLTTSEGEPLPIFALQYAGGGKVLWHATDDTWRWRYQVGDVFFARYWVQAIRYLSRSKLLGKDRSAELTTDRREYERGDSVRLRLQFIDDRQAPANDDGVTVMLQRQAENRQTIKLHRNATSRGVFEGVVSRPPEGTYHAWLATPTLSGPAPTADFTVAAPPGEFARLQVDSAALRRASEETHGQFYTIDTVDSLLKDLPAGRQIPVETLPPVVLWNKWPLLVLFLGLISTEWILRKRKGML